MSSIILNGVSSTTIPGLIIQSIPTIIKPKIRTQIEEIYGRDGDIVTPLGYEAYDKTVIIGLSWNYNIDQIIKYFNSNGTVVFSDEPDKYYTYRIIEQIEFERLLRFKTATVKFHVQPFKYLINEEPKTYNITTETSITVVNSGNIYARPLLTLTGIGAIALMLNNEEIFSLIGFGENERTINLDMEAMEAYTDTLLVNRSVSGDYDEFKLEIGSNTISWDSVIDGSVSKIVIKKYTRFI